MAPHNLITDVAGVLVGHAEDARVASGVTAVIFEEPAIASSPSVMIAMTRVVIRIRTFSRAPPLSPFDNGDRLGERDSCKPGAKNSRTMLFRGFRRRRGRVPT